MLIERVYAILDSIKPNANGCMIWPKHTKGIPQVNLIYKLKYGVKDFCGVGRYTVRRLVVERGTDSYLDDTKKVISTCGVRNCVNKDHLLALSNKLTNSKFYKARRDSISCDSV
jgi:hypothetical protein